MKLTLTRYTSVIASAIFCMSLGTGNAQSTGKSPQNLPGYSFAKENGIIAKTSSPLKLGNAEAIPTVKEASDFIKERLGIKPETSSEAKSEDYEFYAPHIAGGYDMPLASVIDAEGNTYITGASTDQENTAGNLTTIKLDNQGEIIWEVRKAVTEYAVEMGFNISLDSEGDLIIAGSLWNGTDFDIQVLKYSTEGDLTWESSYQGDGGGIDLPADIAIDFENNILITGMSWSGNSIDYLTIKYSSNGEELWSAIDNGFGEDTWNEPLAITSDAENNVYVTGYSSNEEFWAGYYTVKYSSAGEEIWAQRYTSQAPSDPEDPESPLVDWNSLARDIVVDGEGNTYVTGSFNVGMDEMGTIKYNEAGEQLWIQTYKSGLERTDAYKIAEGADGSLFVAGSRNGSFSDDGFVLISYSPEGEEQWLQETIDVIDMHDIDLKLDASGDPVVAGWASLILDDENFIMVGLIRAQKYSSSGDPLEQASIQMETADTSGFLGLRGLELDSEDNIHLAAHAFYTHRGSVFETAKFAEGTGEEVWNTVYTSEHRTNAGMLMSFADQIGNTYSTGEYFTFTPGGNSLDYNRFLSKHNETGDVEWDLIYNADNGNDANGILATADADNNLLVMLLPVPTFDGSPWTYKLKKYTNAGELIWEIEKDYLIPAIYDVQTDNEGNIYLSGAAQPDDLDYAVFVLSKFSPEGEELWTSFHDVEGADAYSAGTGLVTAGGEFIQPGSAGIGGWFDQQLNFTVSKYAADGSLVWSTAIEMENVSSGATEVLMDEEGNIYATGTAENSGTFQKDILTAKFNSDGEVLWSELYGEGDRNESAYTLERLSSGDIVVVGYSLQNMSGEIHNAVIRYDEEGEEIWVAESASMRYFYGSLVDGNDNIFVLNQIIMDPFPYRLINALAFAQAGLTKIDSNGNVLEEDIYTGPEHTEFYPSNLIAHTDGRLLMGGTLVNESFYSGVFFMEWDELLPLSIGDDLSNAGDMIGQNFPNPFKDQTVIPFSLKKTGMVEISVFDMQGRLVGEPVNRVFAAGENQFTFSGKTVSPGQYIYQVKTDDYVQSGKMTLIN